MHDRQVFLIVSSIGVFLLVLKALVLVFNTPRDYIPEEGGESE